MTLRLKGEASFDHAFDGGQLETLTIALTVSALMRVEEEGGIGLLDAIGGGLKNLTTTALLLRHGLIEAGGRNLSREEAGEILLRNPTAFGAVIDALTAALPDADKPANPPMAAKKRRGTGKTS